MTRVTFPSRKYLPGVTRWDEYALYDVVCVVAVVFFTEVLAATDIHETSPVLCKPSVHQYLFFLVHMHANLVPLNVHCSARGEIEIRRQQQTPFRSWVSFSAVFHIPVARNSRRPQSRRHLAVTSRFKSASQGEEDGSGRNSAADITASTPLPCL